MSAKERAACDESLERQKQFYQDMYAACEESLERFRRTLADLGPNCPDEDLKNYNGEGTGQYILGPILLRAAEEVEKDGAHGMG